MMVAVNHQGAIIFFTPAERTYYIYNYKKDNVKHLIGKKGVYVKNLQKLYNVHIKAVQYPQYVSIKLNDDNKSDISLLLEHIQGILNHSK